MNDVYDLIGIGIGPFNLGLAALAEPIPGLCTVFLEQKKQFSWHEGLMIEGATLQVPFYADLVTLADPCSVYSFLNFLKAKNRMFRFACNENYYIERREYQQYCRWVASMLGSLNFDQAVKQIQYNERDNRYEVLAESSTGEISIYYGKHLVIGIGTVPSVPACAAHVCSNSSMFHSSQYLQHKTVLMNKNKITVVGSGQSAAEIFYDLLKVKPAYQFSLDWFTHSAGFYQMETSKLVCEFTSPDYINYFYQLEPERKTELLKQQDHLYKGINRELIEAIYRELYAQSIESSDSSVRLIPATQLTGIEQKGESAFQLSWLQTQQQKCFQSETEALILATGYQNQVPAFMDGIKDRIYWTGSGRYQVKRNYSIDVNGSEIFVQNAELLSHGFSAPDLGLGPYRNMMIINTILGDDYFKVEKETVFQRFTFDV
ncbi:lysine N(6)-hydroxylase/L-ornithine N(5)-oxygenase family protein [Lacibacter sp.]|uniref:lysine N(6)-hydroxylase/L-ornithine N(5)-oxygenase family protein n=1 Tax=Lacibacter sp. TaxID=1915409 RepID=UPI002B4B74E3|nr:SidA/IucD/PvdA family monooxygenase [Lacibacter sp.]HLP37718.1 SidA/IucD/PvdA family monooxygenase [Lacibacter sp.]